MQRGCFGYEKECLRRSINQQAGERYRYGYENNQIIRKIIALCDCTRVLAAGGLEMDFKRIGGIHERVY